MVVMSPVACRTIEACAYATPFFLPLSCINPIVVINSSFPVPRCFGISIRDSRDLSWQHGIVVPIQPVQHQWVNVFNSRLHISYRATSWHVRMSHFSLCLRPSSCYPLAFTSVNALPLTEGCNPRPSSPLHSFVQAAGRGWQLLFVGGTSARLSYYVQCVVIRRRYRRNLR